MLKTISAARYHELNPKRPQIKLFQTLYTASTAAEVHAMGDGFLRNGDVRCALLAFDGWSNLIQASALETMTDPDSVLAFLQPYRFYGQLLRKVTRSTMPFHQKAFNQLMGVDVLRVNKPGTQDTAEDLTRIAILRHSFIYRWGIFKIYNGPSEEATNQVQLGNPLFVAPPVAEQWSRRALLIRLNTVLYSLHTSARSCGAFQLCGSFVATGYCARKEENACSFSHPKSEELSITGFNTRLAMHMHLIATLDPHAAVDDGWGEERSRKSMQGFVTRPIS